MTIKVRFGCNIRCNIFARRFGVVGSRRGQHLGRGLRVVRRWRRQVRQCFGQIPGVHMGVSGHRHFKRLVARQRLRDFRVRPALCQCADERAAQRVEVGESAGLVPMRDISQRQVALEHFAGGAVLGGAEGRKENAPQAVTTSRASDRSRDATRPYVQDCRASPGTTSLFADPYPNISDPRKERFMTPKGRSTDATHKSAGSSP